MPTSLRIDQLPDGASAVPVLGDLVPRRDLSEATLASYTKKDTIARVLNLGKVDSIAALQSITVADIPNGFKLDVLGYTSAGDGAGGEFIYNSASAATPVQGMIVQPSVGAGRWIRNYFGTIDVRWFGVVGDGVTSDQTAFQAALDYLAASGSGNGYYSRPTLDIPPATYALTGGLVVKGNRIKINGNNAKLKATGAFSKIITVGDNTFNNPEQIEIAGLFLDSNSNADYGLFVRDGAFCSFRNIVANTALIANIAVDGTDNRANFGHVFDNCLVGGTTRGYSFIANGNTAAFTDFNLVNCHAEGGTSLIYVDGTGIYPQINVFGGWYENATSQVAYLKAANMNGYGCTFENGNAVLDVYLTNTSQFQSYGAGYTTYTEADSTSHVRQMTTGVIHARTSGSQRGEVFAGGNDVSMVSAVRLGNSRTFNYLDGLVSQNLRHVEGADTYQTLTTGSFAGVEFYWDGVGRKGVRFIASTSNGTAGVPLSPAYPFTMDADGNTSVIGLLKSSSATGGVGYATGAGGTVTQTTSRATGVTINKVCGAITTDTTSLAAGASATFTVTNSTVAATDVPTCSIKSGQTNKETTAHVSATAAGSFDITVHNKHASTAETGAIVINFAVGKAVAS